MAVFETDTHCHTIASTHAYSTVTEMAEYASHRGLRAIVISDHGPAIPDGAHEWHFANLRCLPRYIHGVCVLHGVEANIVDFEGHLDIAEHYQQELDWVIASFHDPVRAPSTTADHSAAYLALAKNPYVDVIGHSGSSAYAYDYERVIPELGRCGKLIEINSHSFEARRGAKENCRKIALICKKEKVPIVVNSDAHSCFSVGKVQYAAEMLESIDFPDELIVNRSFESLAAWILKKRGRNITV